MTYGLRYTHLYRSDLGGMAPVPSDARVAGSTTYVPTTSTAKYLPRRHNHTYNGSAWVDAGTLIETEARTQLLHTTNALGTQSHTVTAVPHTLHFTGTGTVTLSGASTAGPLVGTGTGEENRVSLTFTPTAASLTLTVTGTVTDAQLEVGSKQSSYIPNLAGSGTVNRAADSPLTIAGADVPWPTPTVIGDELVTNGAFDADSDWTKTGATTISGGKANLDGTSGTGLLYQDILAQGRVYQASFDIDSISGTMTVINNDGTTLGTYTTSGSKSLVFVNSIASGNFIFRVTTGSNTATIDNISVKEINPLAVCIQMEGDLTISDEDSIYQAEMVRWQLDANNYIKNRARTTADVDSFRLDSLQAVGGTTYPINMQTPYKAVGVNVPFNIASRHGSTFINGAVGGTALTADTTPVALPDLSSTDLRIGKDLMGNVKQVRIWAVDMGDTGIAEASTGASTSAQKTAL